MIDSLRAVDAVLAIIDALNLSIVYSRVAGSIVKAITIYLKYLKELSEQDYIETEANQS